MTRPAGLGECQEKLLTRIVREVPDRFIGGLSVKNYLSINGASRAKATRDLQDLVEKNILTRTGGLKSTTANWVSWIKWKPIQILLLEWLIIVPPFIYWAFKYDNWLWLTLSISFLLTQLYRRRQIVKIKVGYGYFAKRLIDRRCLYCTVQIHKHAVNKTLGCSF